MDAKPIYEFGDFRLNVEEKQLRRAGGDVFTIPPKAFELLVFMVENPNRLLEKTVLMDRVWADSFVEEGNLKLHIHTLRKALNINGVEFIQTIPRRGYRFNSDVRDLSSGELIVEKITRSTLVIEQTQSDTAGRTVSNPSGSWRSPVVYGVSAVLLIAASSLIYFEFLRPRTNPAALAANIAPTTIAVLPFKNLTGDQKDDYLSFGLSDALTTKLGSVARLAVRPTSSVLKFAETPENAAEKLRVENIVEGTIQRVNDRLRITVQLIKARDQKILWAKNFDEEGFDLIKIQDSIASSVADSLLANLSPSEQSLLATAETNDQEAYELYLKGRFFWNKRTTDDLRRSVDFFDRARQRDGRFSLAYVGLADAYQLLAEYGGMERVEAFQKSREASLRALSINDASAEAHASLAYTLAFCDWNWADAEREFKRSIELNPNYPTARQWYGEYLTTFGRFDEAFAETRRAQELDPTSPIIQTDIAAMYYLTRQYDRSVEQTNRVLELEPKFAYAYIYQWIANEQGGHIDAAYTSLILTDSLFLPPEVVEIEKSAYAGGGWTGLWKCKYTLGQQPPLDKFISSYVHALTALRAGDTEKTFEYLQRSVELHERWSVDIKVDPQWDPIRQDPRFADLIQKTGL